MKKIILVFISAIVVFFLTLLFTNQYMSKKTRESADHVNTHVIDDFCQDFDSELRLASSAINGFFYGDFYFIEDSLIKDSVPLIYIRDCDLNIFTQFFKDDIHDLLRSNPLVKAAVFLIDDSMGKKYPQYGFHENFSIYVGRSDSVFKEIKDLAFMNGPTYNLVKSTHRSIWTRPTHISTLPQDVIIYNIPIFCENGDFFGVIAVNLDMSSLRKRLIDHMPYGKENSEAIIYDEKGRIVMSSPHEYEKYGTISELKKNGGSALFSTEIESLHGHEYAIHDGNKYKIYTRSLSSVNWTVKTACRKDAIYKELKHIRWMIFNTSAVGMILILICCIVAFRQVRDDLRKKAMAENEIQMAAEVQASILKKPHYKCDVAELNAFLRPARDAGGDLYGYKERDGKLIFCIGDVSGKGMPAALFMTQVISLFRDAYHHTSNPDDIVSEINDVLSENNPENTFCTYFVGVVEDNRLTFCNAGHNNPVIIRKDAKPEYLEIESNLAMGLFDEFPYMAESIEFHKGDVLLLYTDGVTEAKNKDDECFGEDSLLTALSSSDGDYVTTTLKSVEQFVGNHEQSDDITIVQINAL